MTRKIIVVFIGVFLGLKIQAMEINNQHIENKTNDLSCVSANQ